MEILKKTISTLLTLAMILTTLPLPALATENETVAAGAPDGPSAAEIEEEETLSEIVIVKTAESAVFAPPVAGYVDEENNDSMATANYIGLHLGTGCYGDLIAWDPDYYTFDTSAYGTGTFEISVEVATFYENFTVALLDGNGNTLCYETDEEPYDGGYIIRFSKTVIGGTFYLSVSTMDSSEVSSSYAFTVTVKEGSFACTHPYANSKVTMPTCVDRGYTTYTCKDCGKVWIMDYTDPTGVHTYSDAQDVTCDVCGEKREEISDGGYCGDNVTWKLKDGILTISGTGGMYGYGYDYWAVATKAPWQEFADTITTVVIENGVTSIGREAFSHCKALTSVTIPDSVKVIDGYAFYDCEALTSAEIPEGVTSIGKWSFYGCDALASITIPKSVNTIADYAFAYARGLKTIHFLGKPENMKDTAFSGVKANAYYIEKQWNASSRKDYGGTLTWIAYTITNCPHPEQTVLEAVAPTCTEPGLTEGQCCAACGKVYVVQQEIPALGHKEKAVVTEPTCADQGYTTYTCQTCKATRKADFTEPTGVHAYTNNQDTTCDVCGTVRDPIAVGGKCGPMATWELCDGILTISGTGAMYDYCAQGGSWAPWRTEEYTVEKVVIQKGVTKIGSEAFRLCTSLTTITIPEGVTSIGEYAFDSCISLNSVTIPGSVTEIGSYAFRLCESLAAATIDAGITAIPKGLFQWCEALASITIPEGVTTIGSNAFENCKALASIALPDSVNTIGDEAFAQCESLTAITIPESVTRIGYGAFKKCSISEITLPENLTELSSDVFFGCGSLKEITIPAGVTRIGDKAFGKCGSLESIIFKGDAPEFLKSYGYEESEVFYLTTADVHYPADNPTWTEEVRRNYGGSITWVPDEPPHVHSYTETVTAPTCTEDGYTTYTCTCGESYVDDYVEAIGHAYDGGTVTTAPGCVTEGVKTFACANDASHTYTETIPAVGHTTGEWKSSETSHWHECAACGEKLDEAAHNANPCTTCGYESVTEGDHPYSLGDVNHDGKINAKDSTLILQYSVGVLKDTANFCETCANVNGDSKLNAKDATMILQYSVGLRTDF